VTTHIAGFLAIRYQQPADGLEKQHGQGCVGTLPQQRRPEPLKEPGGALCAADGDEGITHTPVQLWAHGRILYLQPDLHRVDRNGCRLRHH